jgi:hypothetical protein
VLALAGQQSEAASVLEQAAATFERKGNVTSLERVRALAGTLGPVSPA